MLLEEGIYSNRCPNPKEVCTRQTLDLGFIYTIGGGANLAAQLLWGYILDQKGPRICSFLSVATVFVGIILLGITDNEFDVLTYAMVCIAVGGPGASIACFHLSNLFPEAKNSVLSLFSGAFQVGFMVFMIFNSFASYFTRFQICMVYATLLFVIMLLGLAFWPERSLTAPRDEDAEAVKENEQEADEEGGNPAMRRRGIPNVPLTLTNSPSFIRINQYADPSRKKLPPFMGPLGQSGEISRTESMVESPVVEKTPDHYARTTQLYRVDSDILQFASVSTPTVRRQVKRVKPLLWKQVLSVPFLGLCLWMSASLFFLNFYIGNVADQMFQQAGGNRVQAHRFTSFFTTILPLGAIAIPLYGWSTDSYGLPFAVILSTLFGIIYTVSCVIHDLDLQLLTFVAYSLFRTFVFATFFSLVAKEFGYSSFGVLSGLILFLAGAVCLLQYPVREYFVPDENFDLINYAQLIIVNLVGIVFSIYIAIHLHDSTPAAVKRRREEEKKKRAEQKNYGAMGEFKRPLPTIPAEKES
eukprot:CAMPEP_0184499022 /NCGR_PEP_ID=MMETSP0113_2-20130426/40425_1 /TAXON_ID=91329 /ORGANISM="Norrisiella sphaerica, Strain BC52" /LENGTH=526 /DNA_ID=CAMNT_0026886781 /DNA_START=180 /DNA_END=1760 /DNA_ORIENTATION=+